MIIRPCPSGYKILLCAFLCRRGRPYLNHTPSSTNEPISEGTSEVWFVQCPPHLSREGGGKSGYGRQTALFTQVDDLWREWQWSNATIISFLTFQWLQWMGLCSIAQVHILSPWQEEKVLKKGLPAAPDGPG